MGNLFLLLTIVSESAAVILMKQSDGFDRVVFAVFAFVAYALSFVFLTLALKTLPAGLTNGIWAASSTLLVALAGWLFFKERFTTIQYISLLLIVIGLIGLNINKVNP